MRSRANCESSKRTVCLEELEKRIVFDGAIDQAPNVETSAVVSDPVEDTQSHESSIVLDQDSTPELSRDESHDRGQGYVLLEGGGYRYWDESWDGENGYRYESICDAKGIITWTYVGNYWYGDGNGFTYHADSNNGWEYLGIQWDSDNNGYRYWGDDTGAWLYFGREISNGYGWQYIGEQDGYGQNIQWSYETHATTAEDDGEYYYNGNWTGYWTYEYTWWNGYSVTYGSDPGVGDPDWQPDWLNDRVDGSWLASTQLEYNTQDEFSEVSLEVKTPLYWNVYTNYSEDVKIYDYYSPLGYYADYGYAVK